ncbi:lysine 5,6-aminomutase reactivase subunit KamB [Alkaliphilus hydrothermalis]|uniref:Uncharacterized protein n=1 Tax=Alkaliphilus hydrothermalis TaxID=1482730 RepID=A0ABS2NTJ5_9FIRM|nr:hypothetical protein [Alkaliphilus hydrothermalis]MBM7616258.1 hypothetical protein [Alkaliphilus hydrothermalis]
MKELLDKIFQLNSLAIVGMEKNVGKTTTMNYIIENAWGKHLLGLTSIGIDGEKEDQVTGTDKPMVYVEKGTLIATAKSAYLSSDLTKGVLATTGLQTPMGEVVIFEALSDGFVELMGPSINKYLKLVIQKLKVLGSRLVIVDGALSRRTMASPAIADGVILATGAAVSRDMQEVVVETAHRIDLLQIDYEKNQEKVELVKSGLGQGKVCFIQGDELQVTDEVTAIGAESTIKTGLEAGAEGVIIGGVVGDRLIEYLVSQRVALEGKVIYVEDGTKLFLKEENYRRLQLKGAKVLGLNPINIQLVTVNPYSPEGYFFDSSELCQLLHERIQLPVFDVISKIGVGVEG